MAVAFVAGGAVSLLILALHVGGYPLAAILLGLAFGAELDLAGYITSRYFGVRRFGQVYGTIYLFVFVGSNLSHLSYGFLFDRAGDYDASLWVAMAWLGVAMGCFLGLPSFSDGLGSRSERRSEGEM